jgi:cystathionine gamma-synthase
MIGQELCDQPLWEAGDLGKAIPDSRHAISMALPTWRDVIGYEEKDPRVIDAIESGYPRFLIHPDVRRLARTVVPERPALPYPSGKTANECAQFVVRKSGVKTECIDAGRFWVVTTDEAGSPALHQFWQHAGTGLSSRSAEIFARGMDEPPGGESARKSLRNRLAAWYDCQSSDVFLYHTGMAAFTAAHGYLRQAHPQLPTLQLGFPYVDSLKVQEIFGTRATLICELGESLPTQVEATLNRGAHSGCFLEVPGNPMLGTPDIQSILPLLRQHGIPLIVDDTVATSANIDLREHADLIITSLTKFPAGSGDVMGGALIVRPESPHANALREAIGSEHEELMGSADAHILDTHSVGFPERMQQHNAGGLYLTERLHQHPATGCVYYPKWQENEAYEKLRRPDGGYGALLTILFNNAPEAAPAFYDRLRMTKGPSLGTHYSLACPFTLLAHYHELDWAEDCGVSRYLVRISVGLEDPEDLWQRCQSALEAI